MWLYIALGGAIGAVSRYGMTLGAARLGASSLSGRVAGPASLLAGAGLHLGARGDAKFAAESLVTAFRGDAEVMRARGWD